MKGLESRSMLYKKLYFDFIIFSRDFVLNAYSLLEISAFSLQCNATCQGKTCFFTTLNLGRYICVLCKGGLISERFIFGWIVLKSQDSNLQDSDFAPFLEI